MLHAWPGSLTDSIECISIDLMACDRLDPRLQVWESGEREKLSTRVGVGVIQCVHRALGPTLTISLHYNSHAIHSNLWAAENYGIFSLLKVIARDHGRFRKK